jgi:hypothetical protein
VDGFFAWTEFLKTCSGGAAECCQPLVQLGATCWQAVIDNAARFGSQDATAAM